MRFKLPLIDRVDSMLLRLPSWSVFGTALIAIVWGLASLVVSQQESTSSAQLVAESLVINAINGKGQVQLKNSGREEIRIVGAEVSCACISLQSILPICIAPNKSTVLQLAVDSKRKKEMSSFYGTVLIYTQPSTHPVRLIVREGGELTKSLSQNRT